MSGPLDVLAVMGRSFGIQLPAKSAARVNAELREARAAVAELVEAANRAAVMLKVAGPMCGIHALNETAFYDEAECDGACIHDDCANAAIDLDAALAKFGARK